MISCRLISLVSFKRLPMNENYLLTFSISKSFGITSRRHQSFLNDEIKKETSKLFFSYEAQKLMQKLTGLDFEKVYRTRTVGASVEAPKYKFMTTEQLKKAKAYAIRKAHSKLQMPPLIPVNKGKIEVLNETPEIIGLSKAKYVFTDITYNVSDKKRVIVVREPSGVLRKALQYERHRMNELYFPREGRMYQHPRMFEDEHLQSLLDKGEYEFILDRACCQFEPDDPEFHRVTFKTYRKVNEDKAFNILRSTRHYGSLVFYLCLNKNLDNLLHENLETERLKDAVVAIQLYSLVNEHCEFNMLKLNPNNRLEYIKGFLEKESAKRDLLMDILETYREAESVNANIG